MAWTNEKNIILRDMIRERIAAESNPQEWMKWSIARSWMQIINAYVTNTQKQSMLNDFIDDKVVYLNNVITAEQTMASDTIVSRDILLTNKE